MSIDDLVRKTGKDRKTAQLDYLSAYRVYRVVDGMPPRVAYYSAYAHLTRKYHEQTKKEEYKE